MAAVAALTLLATALGAIAVTQRPTSDPIELQVPALRLGDRASYSEYLRGDGDAEWRPSDSLWFEILQANASLDSQLRLRPHVMVATSLNGGSVVVHRLDLAAQVVFREEGEVTPGTGPAADIDGEQRYVRYDPEDNASRILAGATSWAGRFLTDSQADLLPWASSLVKLMPSEPEGTVSDGSLSLLSATLNGRPIVALTQRQTAVLDVGGRTTEVEVTREVWLSHESPFPLGFIYTMAPVDGGGPGFARLWQLQEYRQGIEPVGVLGPLRPAPVPMAAPVPGPNPQDGQGPGMPYRMDEALARMESEPTLVTYREWRKAHPDAEMVGLSFYHYEAQDPLLPQRLPVLRYEWGFQFSDPHGNSVLVIISRDEQAGTVGFKDAINERHIDPKFFHGRPPHYLTLAEMARVWREVAADQGLGERVNFLDWGMIVSCSGVEGGPPCSTKVMHTLKLGHHGPLVRGEWEHYAYLAINVITGQVETLHTTEGAGAWIESFNGIVPAPAPHGRAASAPPPTVKVERPLIVYAAAASIAVLFLVGALGVLRRILGVTALWPGFTRIDSSDLLHHPTRDHIMAVVRANPGSTPIHLSNQGVAPWSTLIYHLGRLQAGELVRVVRDGRSKRIYEASAFDSPSAKRDAALREPRTAAVMAAVQDAPGISHAELARRNRIRPPSLLPHVRRLEGVGALRAVRMAGRTTYFPN